MTPPVTSVAGRAAVLPGVHLPGRGEGARPERLLTGALLLAGLGPTQRRGWYAHTERHGPLPVLSLDELSTRAQAVDLRGFGGAGFPTATKLRGARGRLPALVVVNGSEGERASAKDGVLLRHVPHLVLDGAQLAAHALGAAGVTVRLSADRPDLPAVVHAAAAERGLPVEVSVGPAAFAAGEASAVVNAVSGREPLPTPLGRPPRTPGRIAARRRPALVSNVETFARLALAARGLPSASALVTVSGAVGTPGVLELVPGAHLSDAVAAAGGLAEPVGAVVTGGWHGRWLPWSSSVEWATLSRAGLDAIGGRWGAGIIVLVPAAACRLSVVAAVARALAAGSAGQCGPCRVGLPFVASELTVAAADAAHAGPALLEAQQAMDALRGRGLCGHPTATVDALRSALAWAEPEVLAHRDGHCTGEEES